jgi:hypothetical protein
MPSCGRKPRRSWRLAGVISGEVAPLGAGFSLAYQIVATDGRVLAMFRESARSLDDLVDAIERRSRGMRARLGDSYRQLHAMPPLARVTTGSIEALRFFTSLLRRPLDPAPPHPEALRHGTANRRAENGHWQKDAL